MNKVVGNGNSLDPHNEAMIDILCEVLGDECGITLDDDDGRGGNCSMGEMTELIEAIEHHFNDDIDKALDAIACGDLKFQETENMGCACEGGCWAWHIKPTIN
jgi:hypothetical protein